MSKVVVVGANHAGTYAINTILDNYNDVEVQVYDRNDNISFLACGMALWIGDVVSEPDGLFYATPEGLEAKGAKIFMEHNVENVDFDNKKVTVRNLNTEEVEETDYDKLIIAVGSRPIQPPIPGMDLENVISAKFFQDAVRAKEIIKDPEIKKIAVVGGGYIGVELAEAFKNSGKEVVLIDNTTLLNKYFDESFRSQMSKNIADHGVTVAENETVQELQGNGKVEKLVTDKNEYDVDVVLMAVGFNANTGFLKDTGLDMTDRGVIKVNNQQETNIKDVYAVGDCATIHNNTNDAEAHIALATNAVRTGIIAGHNAAGTEAHLNGVQGSNAIHIYGLTMASTGYSEESAKFFGMDVDSVEITDNLRPDFMPDNETVQFKIVWDKETKKIVGAQIMSKEDVTPFIHMFSLAIEVGYTIDKLATLDLFFLPHFNKPDNFIIKAGLMAQKKLNN